ncbi:MAG: type IV pilin protein [Thiohalophilus sp.]|uniref:type IV pilin protein n=1 Tax=Thiohalophilus sp. TaxID=3028392 RepID=UPI0028708B01|nr:type IV pilin protein [Thiohalophilus sp.]MDR9436082.1 type IV pilin protein [Thiohalophilus sp.]
MIRKQSGFTLIELMIAVAIISLLAGIAYPSYQSYIEKARRADAKAALVSFANAIERHYTENYTYAGAATGGNDTGTPDIFPAEAPLDGSTKSYDLTIVSADDTTFVLRATPKGGQTGDGYLEITSTGQRRWDKNNDGSIGAGEDTWD